MCEYFMQLGFTLVMLLFYTVALTRPQTLHKSRLNFVKSFSLFLCNEFKSSRKSGGSWNEVDTSLVKSQLIYFHTEK